MGKKVFFWVKNSVSWARSALLHGIYCILYCVEFANLHLHAKMMNLSQKIVNTLSYMVIFALAERLPTSATRSQNVVRSSSVI